tara:strand:+ start:48 stop:305 length:258 start_codon:yes stop_codon:yes gene_type:complete
LKTKKYKRLSFKERVIIQTLIDEKKPKAFIAKKLNRARSTISREIKRFVVIKDDKYDARLASRPEQLWVSDIPISKHRVTKVTWP